MCKKRLYIAIIILQVIAMIFTVGNYFWKSDNLYSQKFSMDEITIYGGELDETGVLHINPENAHEGVVASVAFPKLEKSRYKLHLLYNASANNSYIYAQSLDLAEVMFEAANAYMLPENTSTELSFLIRADSKETTINIYYSGEGELEISGLDVEQTNHVYKQDIFKAFVFCLIGFIIMYLYQATSKQRKIVLGLIFVTLVSSNLVFINYLIEGHDLGFHLNRIESMFIDMQNGIFPVKIQSAWLNGYGYPVGVFYGDLLLYIAVFMRFMGFSIQASYHIFVIVVNLLTTFISYYCFKRLFNNSNMGLAGATIYVLSLYRLENLYSRAAVGEYCAMIFFPMILVGMYEILKNKKEKKYIPPTLLLAFGLSGVIHSHILSCVIVAGFILLTCVIFIKRVLKPDVFFRLVSVVAITVLLSLDFIVPFLDYYTLDFKVNSAEWGVIYIQNMGSHLIQIFSMLVNAQDIMYSPSFGIAAEITIGVGVVPLLGTLIFVYLLLTGGKRQFVNTDYTLAVYAFILFVISVFASTCYFPWDQLSHMNGLFERVIGIIQFPWRFLTMATLFSTVFICVALKEITECLSEGLRYIPTVLVMISVALTVGVYCNSLMLDKEYGNPLYIYEASELNFMQIYSAEYLPEGTDSTLLESNNIVTTDNVEYSNYMKNHLNISCYVSSIDENGYIEFPLLYYKGYVVSSDVSDENLTVVAGENNVVRVELPKDYSGNINVRFEEPIYWRVGEVIALISGCIVWIYLLINVWHYRLKGEVK